MAVLELVVVVVAGVVVAVDGAGEAVEVVGAVAAFVDSADADGLAGVCMGCDMAAGCVRGEWWDKLKVAQPGPMIKLGFVLRHG